MKLVESDFRKIRKLVSEKYGKEYTVDYIRKVCNNQRRNRIIYEMAERYIQVVLEMEKKIEKLSK